MLQNLPQELLQWESTNIMGLNMGVLQLLEVPHHPAHSGKGG